MLVMMTLMVLIWALFARCCGSTRAVCTYATTEELTLALQVLSTCHEFGRTPLDDLSYFLLVDEASYNDAMGATSSVLYPLTLIAIPNERHPTASRDTLSYLPFLPSILDSGNYSDVLLLRPNVVVMSDPFYFNTSLSHSGKLYCSMPLSSTSCDMNAMLFRDTTIIHTLASHASHDYIELLTAQINISILRLPGAYSAYHPTPTSHLPLLLSHEPITLLTFPVASNRYAIINILNPEDDPCVTPTIRCGVQVPKTEDFSTPLLHAFHSRLHDPHVCRRLLRCDNLYSSSITYQPGDYDGYFNIASPVISQHVGLSDCFLSWTHGPYDEETDSYSLNGFLTCNKLIEALIDDNITLQLHVNGAILSKSISSSRSNLRFSIHALLLDGQTKVAIHAHVVSDALLYAVFTTEVLFPRVQLHHPQLVRHVGGDAVNNFQTSFFQVSGKDNMYAVVINNLSTFYMSDLNLRNIFKRPATQPYVLVTGMFHSGTTILQKILSNHPNAHYIGIEMLPYSFMADAIAEYQIFKLPWLYWDAVLDPIIRHDDWKTVVIVRNLYDVLGSILCSQNLTEDTVEESLLLHSELWHRSYVNAVLLKSYPSRVMIIRYEDLFDKNHSYIRGVYNFVGMSFEPEFVLNNEAYQAQYFNSYILDGEILDRVHHPGEKHRLQQINERFVPRINTWRQCKYGDLIATKIREDTRLISALIYFGYVLH